jgi:hypothetical protein
MLNRHALADKAGALLFEKADRRFDALVAERGVSSPRELPRDLQVDILRRAMLEASIENFPTANLEALDHGIRSFLHPAFAPAWERMRLATKGGSDAFGMSRGIYAAVVLAGFALPVAPFDLVTTRILAKPSNDIETVLELFSSDKGALVGYNTCTAPFYVLLTDCVQTMTRLVPTHPLLSEINLLVERSGASMPPDPGHSFRHSVALALRQPGDAISTVGLLDPNPAGGSIMLYAGWQIDGAPYGAPNDGYMPVPTQLLRAVVYDPAFAYALCHPVSAPPTIH